MKYCIHCNSANYDDSAFCAVCGKQEFSGQPAAAQQPAATIQQSAAAAIPQPVQLKEKPRLGIAELFSILGFVASIIGMFCCSIVLHPIAAVSSIFGFVKASRYRALALTGFVVAIVGGIVRIMLAMHDASIIPEWWVDGAFV